VAPAGSSRAASSRVVVPGARGAASSAAPAAGVGVGVARFDVAPVVAFAAGLRSRLVVADAFSSEPDPALAAAPEPAPAP
jgi:hypothetical protein